MKKTTKSFKIGLALLLTFMISVFIVHPYILHAAEEVCEIVETGVKYESLDDALAAVADGETIKLIANINYTSNIVITNKSLAFDMNGFILSVQPARGHALEVGENGEVKLVNRAAGGQFNVTGTGSGDMHGVYAHNGGKAEVHHATSLGSGTGARGAYVTGAGSEITVYGNIIFNSFYGLSAFNGGKITVYGNCNGGGAMTVGGDGTEVYVYGNSSGGGTGVFAYDQAFVYIKGNVIGGGAGVYVYNGAKVVVDGTIRATSGGFTYIEFADTPRVLKMQGDFEPTSSRAGYFEYNNGISYVWVKQFNPPVYFDVFYIYDNVTEYSDQNATNTVATKVTNIAYNTEISAAPDPQPTKDGYLFKGWFTETNSGGILWNFGAGGTKVTLENGVNAGTKALTLYAGWEEIVEQAEIIDITYFYDNTIEYTNQNDTGITAVKLNSGEYGSRLASAPNPVPAKVGYHFIGWFTRETGGTKWLFNADSGTLLTEENGVNKANNTLTLYAHWQDETLTSSAISINYIYNEDQEYDNQNALRTPVTKTLSVDLGSRIATAPNPQPTRPGYQFEGWNTKANGAGKKWVFDAVNGTIVDENNGVDMTEMSLTLFAQWRDLSSKPNTGDQINIYLIALLAISGTVALYVGLKKRKN